MAYVDGFLLPIAKSKLAAYKRVSKKAGKAWMKLGALEYRECVSDDLDPKGGKVFTRGVKLKKGEVVFFSWIVYKSKADRNRINKKVMALPEFANSDPSTMPFDMKRMGWGGFKVAVDL
jgi:uncharacterized protein YbaA (DUF1428 family)